MGCITSKHGGGRPVTDSPAPVVRKNSHGFTLSSSSSKNQSGRFEVDKDDEKLDENVKIINPKKSRELKKSKRDGSGRKSGSFSFKLGFSQRFVEAEQLAAGWPAWLSSAAGEAVHGWVPLQADSFEKLDKVFNISQISIYSKWLSNYDRNYPKYDCINQLNYISLECKHFISLLMFKQIGQGTYSSVFKAREVETGRLVALKKVRFDNFQPESIRFMAREITILRRLNHPNVMKLEGVVTSRFSSTIYLVFEYMEHDLAGLSSCPDINFTEAQVCFCNL